MRSPIKLKENKSLVAGIVATVAHNAMEYLKKVYPNEIPLDQRKQSRFTCGIFRRGAKSRQTLIKSFFSVDAAEAALPDYGKGYFIA